MAIAGGATAAYWVRLRENKVTTERTTIAATLCDSPQAAVIMVKRGEVATVQGSDMDEFWQLWNGGRV
jgi:phosphotransacetylase